jgi:hypothetical protein
MNPFLAHWKNFALALLAVLAVVAVWAILSPPSIRSQDDPDAAAENAALLELTERLRDLEERFDTELLAIRQAWQNSGEPAEALVSAVESWRDDAADDIEEVNVLEPIRDRIVVVASHTPEEVSARIDRRLEMKS